MSTEIIITDEFIDRWIDEHKDEMLDELGQWVSHPSVSRADLAEENAPFGKDVRKMLDFALERGRHYGFEAEDYNGYAGAVIYGDKNADNQIGFVSHLDVVPEGDSSRWIYPPYEMTIKDGYVIGRGVGDNKGSGVACLFLMRFFAENNIPLNNTLRLFLGTAEETGMADFRYYRDVLKGYFPYVTIVADAGFPVCYAQKGGYDGKYIIKAGRNLVNIEAGTVRNAIPDITYLTVNGITKAQAEEILKTYDFVDISEDGVNVKLTVHGKAGHAAFPEGGINAIVRTAQIGTELEKNAGIDLAGLDFIADVFRGYYGEGAGIEFSDEESGKLTFNAGVIRTENGEITLLFDIRYPVTDNPDNVKNGLQAAADRYGVKLETQSVSDPYYIDRSDERVTALLDAYREVTGDMTEPYSMGGGTYSRVIPNGISFGPGLRSRHGKPEFLPEGHGNAHGLDEVMNIEDWLTGLRIYIKSVLRLDKIIAEKNRQK